MKKNIANKKKKQNLQSGQTVLEFVLLLATVMFLAFTFMRTANRGIGRFWIHSINFISKPHDGNGLTENDLR